MDKRTATLTLTEKLVNHNGYQIVSNPVYQKKLIENAVAYYQIGDVIKVSFYDIRTSIKEKNEVFKKMETGANYFFLDNFLKDSYIFGSSLAIIGEEEVNSLRKIFYKSVSHEIVQAMNILSIKNFIEIYQHYINSDLKSLFSDDYYPNGLERVLKFLDTVPELTFDGDGEISESKFINSLGSNIGSLNSLNDIFKKLGITACISPEEDRETDSRGYIHKNNILKVTNELNKNIKHYLAEYDFLNDFFRFVFSLPPEEQNVKSNKKILKKSKDLEFVINVMCEKYEYRDNFCEYFDVLNKNVQQKVVSALKSVPRNTIYDSFLWKQGFKDVELDYLKLYREDTSGFIEYFKSKGFEEKKAILDGIMDCEFTNDDVVRWLDENEPELIKEVGLKNA